MPNKIFTIIFKCPSMQQPSSKIYFFITILLFHMSAIQSRSFKVLPAMDQTECYTDIQDNLAVSVQLFTHQDSKHYFGYDLIQYGYRPLLLQISNNTDNLFLLKPLLCNTDLVKSSEIVKRIEFPVIAILSTVGIPVLYHNYRALSLLGLAGVGLWHYNKKLENELLENTLDEENILKIVPFSTVKKLIFCKEETFLSSFDINFNNESVGGNLTFHIDLLQKKT